MRSEDSYDLVDALDALHEKCLAGYRVAIYYDPRDNTSWLTWAPAGAPQNSETGRGIRGIVFDKDIFPQQVRQFIIDATRIKSLRAFRKNYEPPVLGD